MIEKVPFTWASMQTIAVASASSLSIGDEIRIHAPNGGTARILDVNMWDLVVTRSKWWRAVLILYRIKRTWRLTSMYLFKVLEIWQLAYIPPGAIPGWGCVKWPGRHKEDN